MLHFHNSARILTALINIQVSKYHKGETGRITMHLLGNEFRVKCAFSIPIQLDF